MTAMDVAQAHGQERVYQILQESQRSCVSEQHTEETNIGGIDSSPVEQQTEDTDVEATDKPPVEHLTEETNIGGTNKSPQSDHRQQVCVHGVIKPYIRIKQNANMVVVIISFYPLKEKAPSMKINSMCSFFQI